MGAAAGGGGVVGAAGGGWYTGGVDVGAGDGARGAGVRGAVACGGRAIPTTARGTVTLGLERCRGFGDLRRMWVTRGGSRSEGAGAVGARGAGADGATGSGVAAGVTPARCVTTGGRGRWARRAGGGAKTGAVTRGVVTCVGGEESRGRSGSPISLGRRMPAAIRLPIETTTKSSRPMLLALTRPPWRLCDGLAICIGSGSAWLQRQLRAS